MSPAERTLRELRHKLELDARTAQPEPCRAMAAAIRAWLDGREDLLLETPVEVRMTSNKKTLLLIGLVLLTAAVIVITIVGAVLIWGLALQGAGWMTGGGFGWTTFALVLVELIAGVVVLYLGAGGME